jgi:endonuclease-3
MNADTFLKVLEIVKREHRRWNSPVITLMAKKRRDPFRVLIGTLLSSRTKDEVTGKATERLFKLADNPRKMSKLSKEKIERTIYPVGFYREKARRILQVSKILVERFGGEVPNRMEDLLSLPGVGRKTANLVLSEAFGIPAICVDTHVHRIVNRLGFVRTKSPLETEMELMRKVPRSWWIPINKMFVAFGQSICKPVGPKCGECPVEKHCDKVGVKSK